MANGSAEHFEGYRTPEWANRPPPQPFSLTAKACFSCHSEPEDVPEHPAFATKGEKRPAATRYRKPKDQQMAMLFEGFRQLSNVSLCFSGRDGEVEQLQGSEKAELLAAHDPNQPRDPNAAPPRAFALTLLVRESAYATHRQAWLNCMAYWANCGDADERAARHVRMAVLADQDARKYSVKHGQGLKEVAELALIFVAPDGQVAMVKSPLPYKDTGRKMFKALRTAAATLFDHAKQTPPNALFRTMDVGSETVAEAYVLSYKRTADAFWDTMIAYVPPPELHGELLAFAGVFVKIAKDAVMKTPQRWTHEAVDYGVVCYKKGMQDHLHDFLMKARAEELVQGAPPYEACLRPADQDADELSLNLHILRVSHRFVDLKDQVSCYGMRNSPGELMTPWFAGHLGFQGVVFDMAPFTKNSYNWTYVLPCDQEGTLTLVDRHTYPQWNLADLAIQFYGRCFHDDGDDASLEAMLQPLKRPRKPEGAPGAEDALLADLVGDPFFSGAFRIGDVYERLGQDARVRMPALAAFLVSAIGQLGPDAPMSRALATCTELRILRNAEVESLRSELEALKSAAPPVVAPTGPDTGPFPFGVVTRIITGMGRERAPCFKLAGLKSMQRAKVIVKILAIASGVEIDQAQVGWVSTNCEGLDHVDAVAKAGHRMASPLLIVARAAAGEARFLAVNQDDGGAIKTEPVDLKSAVMLSVRNSLTVVLYREDSTQLIACPLVSAAT